MVLSRKKRAKLRAEINNNNNETTNPENSQNTLLQKNDSSVTGKKRKERGEKAMKMKMKMKKKKKAKSRKKVKVDEPEPENPKVEIGEQEKVKTEVENGGRLEQIVEENSKVNDEAKKVYVGGMPYYSSENDIRSYFSQCGVITEIDCMFFPETGKFRGIAILSFETEEGAENALELDGSDMGGLYLTIQPYKSTRPTKTSNFSPPVIEGYNRIYTGNLSWDITENDLRKFFSDCNISTIRFGEDKETGDFKGYAHIDFSDALSLEKALKMDQKFVCGRPIKISRAVPRKGTMTNEVTPSTIAEAIKVVTSEIESEVIPVVMPETESVVEESLPSVVESKPVVSSGKLKRRTCYDCGERGHISSDCPKKQNS